MVSSPADHCMATSAPAQTSTGAVFMTEWSTVYKQHSTCWNQPLGKCLTPPLHTSSSVHPSPPHPNADQANSLPNSSHPSMAGTKAYPCKLLGIAEVLLEMYRSLLLLSVKIHCNNGVSTRTLSLQQHG